MRRKSARKNPDAVLIFIIAPSVEDLRARLYGRAEDTAEEIERRIQHVRNEVSYLPTYDYVVINQDFDEALLNLMSIIYAERSRRALTADRLPEDFRPE
ncbi:MAG: hypothetical protein M5R36_22090 [Deltaproteobacteria bacterium]|nr:hypothetical protein [Deltaproteobacteria bacterium]